MKLISLRCPECGANLNIKDGREECFCEYCGTKIKINDDTVHTYKTVDEAKIREVEAEKEIRLKELEQAEKLRNDKKQLAKILGIAGLICFILGMLIGRCLPILAIIIWVIALKLWRDDKKEQKEKPED